ncbi:DUF2029 domain-containing protein [Patescibacteria group bacterium]|nr:DUF2029 domain-containing protein [Patescibacteria group bacterium]
MKVQSLERFYKAVILFIFVISVILRLLVFDQEGGDHSTFKTTVMNFLGGVNPYIYTVQSFEDEKLKHGYSYMPTLLYIQTFFTKVNMIFDLDLPTKYMWKVPVLIADIIVGILLCKILKKEKFPYSVIIFGLLFWFIHPYFFMKYEYTNYDVLPVLFLLISVFTVGKKDFISGVMYALSVTLKTFPIILISIFLIKTKDLKKFILGGFLITILLSLPFITSVQDAMLYINGALLVHGSRSIQGRPFFGTFTYYLQDYGVNFYQAEFNEIYTMCALLGAQILPLYLFFKKKVNNIWILIITSFSVYYLFTPVLNRTHFIWGTPFIYLGSATIFKNKLKKHFVSMTVLYVFLCFYLAIWNKGLKEPATFGGRVWLDPVLVYKPTFSLIYELRSRFIKGI